MRDLDYYRNLQRPVADVNVGDEVMVTSLYTPCGDEKWGHVTKTARVWITVKIPAHSEQQFRRDTQHDKDDRYRFATPAQTEFDETVKTAKRVLRDHRVEVTSRATVPDGHLIAMADLLIELDQPAKKP